MLCLDQCGNDVSSLNVIWPSTTVNKTLYQNCSSVNATWLGTDIHQHIYFLFDIMEINKSRFDLTVFILKSLRHF